MKNLKPSQMPVNTVVEVPEDHEWAGEYIKVDNSIYGIYWDPIGCEDCQGVTGVSNTLVDERFTDFKILAIPPGYRFDDVELHGDWNKYTQTYADGSGSHGCTGVDCEA